MKTLATALLAFGTVLAALPMVAAESADGPERFVVRFDALPDEARSQGRYLNADVLSMDEVLRFAVVQAPHGRAFRDEAAARPEVRSVEADPLLSLAAMVPNDPEFSVSQYGPQFVGAPAAWEQTMGSASVKICILDTGVRYTHQDLAANYAGGIDFVNGDSNPMDDKGHGTHVAGIATAVTGNGLGIAGISQSSFLAVKVLDATGNGYMSTIATGIRWCADNGAKVISMSLGATSGTAAVLDAVEYAWARGAVLVAAAGNGGCSNCVLFPAAYDHVIAVGCIDQNRAVCSWTSQGPQVDLAAPGNGIQSTWFSSDTALMRASGTSMSAPHVAGAAALVFAAHPEYGNAQVREALEGAAQDVAAVGRDDATGFGIVRADLAMVANVTGAAPPAPPAPPAAEPEATHGIAISPAKQSKAVAPRGTVVYTFDVQNTGSVQETVTVAKAGTKSGWTSSLADSSLVLEPGQAGTVTLTVTAAAKGPALTVTLTAALASDAMVKATATASTTIAK